jgi:hypothetical protein
VAVRASNVAQLGASRVHAFFSQVQQPGARELPASSCWLPLSLTQPCNTTLDNPRHSLRKTRDKMAAVSIATCINMRLSADDGYDSP